MPYYVSLHRIRADHALADMVLLKPGRLSVQPVEEPAYHHIVELGHIEPPPAPPKPPKAKRVAKPAAKPTAKAKPGGRTKPKTKPVKAKPRKKR
jgi:hypothetical protein